MALDERLPFLAGELAWLPGTLPLGLRLPLLRASCVRQSIYVRSEKPLAILPTLQAQGVGLWHPLAPASAGPDPGAHHPIACVGKIHPRMYQVGRVMVPRGRSGWAAGVPEMASSYTRGGSAMSSR